MDEPDSIKHELAALGQQLDRVLDMVKRLSEENHSLRHSQQQLTSERARLVACNEQAHSRVKTMIERLEALKKTCERTP